MSPERIEESKPGGDVTDITSNAGEPGGLDGKRLELLLQLMPQARKVAFLSGDKSFIGGQQYATSMLAAGRALGVDIMIVECSSDRDYEAALAKMVEGQADAMIVGTFPLPNIDKVVQLAALHKLPTIYPFGPLARAGGLMSYRADEITISRRLGRAYVARILKGERPADLPVEQPTKFDLVINLWAAKALNLEVPPSLLAVSDEVIEYEPAQGAGEYFPYGGWKLVPTHRRVSRRRSASAASRRRGRILERKICATRHAIQIGALTQVVGTIPVEDLKMLSSWKPMPKTPQPDSRQHRCCAVGGRIYLIYGFTPGGVE